MQIEIFLVMCDRYVEWRVRVLQIVILLVTSYRYMEWFVFLLKMEILLLMSHRYIDTLVPTTLAPLTRPKSALILEIVSLDAVCLPRLQAHMPRTSSR